LTIEEYVIHTLAIIESYSLKEYADSRLHDIETYSEEDFVDKEDWKSFWNIVKCSFKNTFLTPSSSQVQPVPSPPLSAASVRLVKKL